MSKNDSIMGPFWARYRQIEDSNRGAVAAVRRIQVHENEVVYPAELHDVFQVPFPRAPVVRDLTLGIVSLFPRGLSHTSGKEGKLGPSLGKALRSIQTGRDEGKRRRCQILMGGNDVYRALRHMGGLLDMHQGTHVRADTDRLLWDLWHVMAQGDGERRRQNWFIDFHTN